MTGRRTNVVTIKTPEGIVFSLPLAGTITRFLAWLVDFACISAISGAVTIVLAGLAVLSADIAVAGAILGPFAVSIGYGIAMEWYFRGQTFGKRVLRCRVVDEQGLRLRFPQVAIRNLLRAVDSIPLFYLVGGISTLVSRRSQRIGDIAAGTIVVRIPPAVQPDLDQISFGKYNSFRDHPHLVARLRQQVSPHEASLALDALLRRETLDPLARVDLFRDIARFFRAAARFPPEATEGLSDEQYIKNVVEVLFRTGR
ncbi:MAG: RDD family protein [Deltaproteobacteria bacterium]|nr:RDD family protein [Deltaproteobacteria bacterium]